MIWITGGLVYDVASGTFSRSDLALQGSRIAGVEKNARPLSNEPVIDATGLHLLPGLIDCHVHLVMRGEDADPAAIAPRSDAEVALHTATAAERTLRGGVTTVRDVGGWNRVELALRDEVERGARPGPRLFLAARLLSAPTPAAEYYPGMYRVVRGPKEVRAAVLDQLDAGADLIKVMATGAMLSPENEDAGEAQLTPEELGVAVDTAASRGARVAAHAHALEGIRNAVEAGVASIEHGTFADEAVLRLMAERGIFIVATLSASPLPDDPILDAMPVHIRTRFDRTRQVHVEAMSLAHRLGVPFAMGTDAGTPGNHHGQNTNECVRLVEEVGMAPEESIRAATLDAAHLLGHEEDTGSLDVGKYADVAGFGSNPLQNIRALNHASLVVAGGRPVLSQRMRGAASRRPLSS